MNKKILSTYLVGAVAGLGLAMGSVAFAQNMGNSNNHTMGQSVNMGTHGSNTMGHTNQAGMNGQVMQNGMHKQTAKMVSRGNMHSGTATPHTYVDDQTSDYDETL